MELSQPIHVTSSTPTSLQTFLPTSAQWLRRAAGSILTVRTCQGRTRVIRSPAVHERASKTRARLLTALYCATGSSSTVGLQVPEARSLLKEFTRQEAKGLAQSFLDTSQKRQLLKSAVLAIVSMPWPTANYDPTATPSPVLLGIVSSDVRLAVRSLRDYTHALKLPYILPESRVPGVAALHAIRGAVYIKYDAGSKNAYASLYSGRDRGVLLTLGQEQIGHLPLGLFDEAMAAPPPSFS